MSYPTSIDSVPEPSATSPTNNPSASGVSVAQTNAIVALETKMGTGSSTAVAGQVLTATGTGTSAWAPVTLSSMATGVLPVVNGGTGVTTKTGTGNVVLSSSPVITTPTGIVASDVGLGNVNNTSDATKNAATATLTNKSMDGGSNTFTNLTGSSLANGTVNTVNTKLDTINHTFNTGSSSDFSTTSATYVDVTGSSFTYTAPTGKGVTLLLWANLSMYVSGTGGYVSLNVNGLIVGKSAYSESTVTVTPTASAVVTVASGATVTIKLQAKIDGTHTINVFSSNTRPAEGLPLISGFAVSQ